MTVKAKTRRVASVYAFCVVRKQPEGVQYQQPWEKVPLATLFYRWGDGDLRGSTVTQLLNGGQGNKLETSGKSLHTWALGSVPLYTDSPNGNTWGEYMGIPLPVLVKVTDIAGSVKPWACMKGMTTPRNTIHIKCKKRFLPCIPRCQPHLFINPAFIECLALNKDPSIMLWI